MSSQFISTASDTGAFARQPGEQDAAHGLLQAHQQLELDGTTDLSAHIAAHGGACVFGVRLALTNGGDYAYCLEVDAQGASGAFGGGLHLRFRDESGRWYCLYVYTGTRMLHVLRYNSHRPNITHVEWGEEG